jgi:hypothetical protein
VLRNQLFRHAIDTCGIRDVELERRHARIGGDHRIEMPAAAPSDNDLVPEFMERFGEPPPVMKMVLPLRFIGFVRGPPRDLR